MSEIAVRRCGAEDATFAAEALALVAEGTADADHLGRVLDDPDVILSVATVAGAPVGVVYGYVYPTLTKRDRATLLYERAGGVLSDHDDALFRFAGAEAGT